MAYDQMTAELIAENAVLREALEKIADDQSTEGYLRDIRGGNAEIARAALAKAKQEKNNARP